MTDDEKRLPAKFYLLPSSGREPVREWLMDLSPSDKKTIGIDVKTVEYGWPIGMPTCKSLGEGLWEIRSDISDRRIARILFCVKDGCMVLLHGFVKKTQKTPDDDLNLARRRMKDLLS